MPEGTQCMCHPGVAGEGVDTRSQIGQGVRREQVGVAGVDTVRKIQHTAAVGGQGVDEGRMVVAGQGEAHVVCAEVGWVMHDKKAQSPAFGCHSL